LDLCFKVPLGAYEMVVISTKPARPRWGAAAIGAPRLNAASVANIFPYFSIY
jgi:hypothetical protein